MNERYISQGQHRAQVWAEQENARLVEQITEMIKRPAPFNDTIEGKDFEQTIHDQ